MIKIAYDSGSGEGLLVCANTEINIQVRPTRVFLIVCSWVDSKLVADILLFTFGEGSKCHLNR